MLNKLDAAAVEESVIMEKKEIRIISSAGLKPMEIDPITETQKNRFDAFLELYNEYYPEKSLYDDLIEKGWNDFDEDGLLDIEELMFESNGKTLIEFDQNGDMMLKTYNDYKGICGKNLFYVENGLQSSSGMPSAAYKSYMEYVNSFWILPIKSDPTSIDSDGDGIEDKYDSKKGKEHLEQENKVTIDDRYNVLNPLKADTLESLFANDISYLYNNTISNPVYYNIKKNDIYMEVNLEVIINDKDVVIRDSDGNEIDIEETIKSGIRERWERNEKTDLQYYKVTAWDFYPGLNIKLYIEFVERDDYTKKLVKNKSINYTCKYKDISTTAGVTIQYKFLWSLLSDKQVIISMQPKSVACSINMKTHISAVAAHEFGHCVGIGDAYNSNDGGIVYYNNFYPAMIDSANIRNSINEIYYTPIDNGIDITKELSSWEIMKTNGRAIPNDVEMILYALSEHQYQYFTPSNTHIISKAIRTNTMPYYNYAQKRFFYYDREKNKLMCIGNDAAYIIWVKDNYGIELSTEDLRKISYGGD